MVSTGKNNTKAKKVYIMKDCMSAVVIPGGPDFTDDANKALNQFASEGMNVVESTNNSWLEAVIK